MASDASIARAGRPAHWTTLDALHDWTCSQLGRAFEYSHRVRTLDDVSAHETILQGIRLGCTWCNRQTTPLRMTMHGFCTQDFSSKEDMRVELQEHLENVFDLSNPNEVMESVGEARFCLKNEPWEVTVSARHDTIYCSCGYTAPEEAEHDWCWHACAVAVACGFEEEFVWYQAAKWSDGAHGGVVRECFQTVVNEWKPRETGEEIVALYKSLLRNN